MIRTALATLATLTLLTVPALAQDAPPMPFDARFVDYSSMLAEVGAGGHGGLGEDVPIAGAHVRFILRGEDGGPRSVEAQTDETGRVQAELPIAGPATVVEFLVSPGGGTSDEPGFYARPWTVASGPAPEVVRCFRVTTDPSVLWISTLSQSITRLDDGTAHLRTLASVVNIDPEFRVFFAVNDPTTGRGAVPIPLPADFELRSAAIDERSVRPDTMVAPHGGRGFALSGTIFPSTRGSLRGTRVFLVATAPWESGRRYDFSFHPEVAVARYVLSVQEASFHVTQPDDPKVRIYDAGPQDQQGGKDELTRAFLGEDIAPHSDVAITVHAGAPFPVRAVITTAVITLMVLAGAFLGIALRRGSAGKRRVAAPAEDVAAPAGTPAADLERLERRLRRGEITSFEFEIRKRALGATPGPRRPGTPRSPKAERAQIDHVAGNEDALDVVGRIEGRVGTATKEQLREDVHALARLVRELLDG